MPWYNMYCMLNYQHTNIFILYSRQSWASYFQEVTSIDLSIEWIEISLESSPLIAIFWLLRNEDLSAGSESNFGIYG